MIDWDRLTEMFADALEVEPHLRGAFLDERCADNSALRAEVDRLLAEHENSAEFIEDSVFAHLGGEPPYVSRFQNGDTLDSRFQIIREIDHGGMGEVYEVEDLILGGRLAAKVLRRDLLVTEYAISQFKKEILLARTVTHPNVCRVLDVGVHEAANDTAQHVNLFFTMELLAGETLASYLERHGGLPLAEALPIIRQTIAGLGAVHQAGIVHGDLKPANIILVPSGSGLRAVLTDFGLAQSLREARTVSSDGPSDFMGTPAYMAPEQFAGKSVSVATDIFALGLTIAAMLTGRHPVHPNSRGELPAAADPTASRIDLGGIDSRWSRVIQRCIAPDVSKRYPDVRALAADVKSMSADPPIRYKAAAILLAGILVTAPVVFIGANTYRQHRTMRSRFGARQE